MSPGQVQVVSFVYFGGAPFIQQRSSGFASLLIQSTNAFSSSSVFRPCFGWNPGIVDGHGDSRGFSMVMTSGIAGSGSGSDFFGTERHAVDVARRQRQATTIETRIIVQFLDGCGDA